MKMVVSFVLMMVGVLALVSSNIVSTKLTSQKSHISFYSHTPVEDITANNYKAVSTIDTQTGDVVFSVPMQSFEFEKALMQKHFNGADFLDSKAHPRAKLIGRITNLDKINFTKNGEYKANIAGELTIKGTTNKINESGTITVSGNVITVRSKFNVTLADYGIAFAKGKPSTNVAKVVEVSVLAEYNPE